MKKILLIDDSPVCLELLKRNLIAKGLEVIIATDGFEGIVYAEQFKPDLIISDVFMPNMDGCAFLMELTTKPELKAIPVIIMSGDLELEERMKDKNIIAFLGKPIDMNLCFEKISETLGITI